MSPVLLTTLLLVGCAESDPYLRPGQWQPIGANSLNLAAMVVNPNDLIRGRGTTAAFGPQATTPVTRLWAGTPATLPTTSSQATSLGQARPGGGDGK